MATYNGAAFIAEQLKSIASQTRPPDELVIQDDGSSDATVELAEQFAHGSSFPVRVLANPVRRGYADNFLSACEHASHEYIAFSDQDDVWLPQKLERTLDELVKKGAVLCAHRANHIDVHGRQYGAHAQGITTTKVYQPFELHPWGFFSGFTEVFSAELLRRIPWQKRSPDNVKFEGRIAHDRWIYSLANSFGKTVTLAETLASYRMHDSNVSLEFHEKEGRPGAGMSRAEYYRKHALIAGANVDLFSQASGLSGVEADRVRQYWTQVAASCDERARIYEEAPRSRRFVRISKMAAGGTYKGFRHGGLGLRALARDVIEGLVLRS